jgi:hypothetical protein
MKKAARSRALSALYPRIHELGIQVRFSGDCAYISRDDLHKALKTKEKQKKFHDLFGIQTCLDKGPYAWDVESVLERMSSGTRTGSQLIWD